MPAGEPIDPLALYRGDDDLSVADWQAAALLWLLARGGGNNPAVSASRYWADRFAADVRPMMSGDVPLGVWQHRLAREAIELHRGAAWVASNRTADLAAAAAGPQIEFALTRLDRFGRQLYRGEAGDVEQVARRAGYYAEHAAVTYWGAARRIARVDGMLEERRVLGPTEHCRTCLAEAEKGWQPLGSLRLIGDSECLWRCACRWDFR